MSEQGKEKETKGKRERETPIEVTPEKSYVHLWKETGVKTEKGVMNLSCGRCELSATTDTKDKQDKKPCKSNRRR